MAEIPKWKAELNARRQREEDERAARAQAAAQV
jgi:hypothetical protein